VARTSNRIVVPPTDGPSAQELADLEMVDHEFHQPGLDLFRETGDYAALADAAFQDWSWTVYRMRSADEMVRDRAKSPRVWMGKLAGPLELAEIQSAYGGGSFEVWGYFDKNLRTRMRVDVSGPRKNFDERPITTESAPAAVSVATAPAAPATDERVVRMIDDLARKVEKLSSGENAAPVGITIKDMIGLFQMFASQNPPANTGSESIKELVETFKMGVELGGEQSGGKRGTLEVVLDKLSPVLEKMATAMVTAPRPMMRRPGPPPPPAGAAVEAETRVLPNEPELPEVDMDQIRMMSAVDSLSRAITGSVDPEDFAGDLEGILSPEQMHLLKSLPEDQVVGVILGAAGGRYPVLLAEPSKVYIAAVLKALKEPPAED
jgi:hypothetical protein